MALTQAQIATIQRSASLGQAQLYAKAWGVNQQDLADIMRGSGVATVLSNIAQQHKEAGTEIPKQSQEMQKLIETHPQTTQYDVRGKVIMPSIDTRSTEWAPPPKPVWEGPGPEPESIITLEATDVELQEIASFHGARCDAPYIHTYRIITPDNQSVFVEVAVNNTAKGKGLAKAKAEAAGYTVHKVVYSPGGASVPSNIPGGQATQAITVSTYDVQFERGKPISVDATSESQAIAIAQNRRPSGLGLVLTATKVKDITVSPEEAAQRIIEAYNRGSLDGVEALCVYGGLLTNNQIKDMFGQVEKMPESGSVPISTRDGIMLITGDYAKLLRETQYYKDSEGGDANRLGNAHTNIQQGYDKWSKAIPILNEAGLKNDEDFTIPNLAKFARDNPNGYDLLDDVGFSDETIKTVRDFNETATKVTAHITEGLNNKTLTTGEKQALARVFTLSGEVATIGDLLESGAMPKSVADWYKQRFGEEGVEEWKKMPISSLEIGLVSDFLEGTWGSLDDDKKIAAAFAFDADFSKGSSFASIIKGMEDFSMKGPWQMTTLAIPVSILSPVGKQITLDEAREKLDKQYSTELSQFADYVNKDGGVPSFDLDKIEATLDSDPKYCGGCLSDMGYDSKKQLLENLEYYNYATQVSPKEWAVAGLVGGLTVLSLGGGTLLGSIGAGGKVAASFLGNAMPVTLGALCLPDTVRVVKDPKSPIWLKGLATGGTALMFAPLLGPTIRGVQFIKIASRGDYVPLRSMSREASTYRVRFTDAKIAELTKAGYTEANIIDFGNQINKQILEGKKVAVVKVPRTGIEIRVKSTDYQRLVGPALFNVSPDGMLMARGPQSQPIYRTLYTEAKVAIEPMQRSYLTGQRAIRPTINEFCIPSDPELIVKLFPQRRLIEGGKTIEPEGAILTTEEAIARAEGLGYRIVPIPKAAGGEGVTFDATLGKVDIRRYTLAKVVEHPTGLTQVKLGGTGDGGVLAIGDLHGTAKYAKVFDTVNSGYTEPLIKGDPKNPNTWQWNATKAKGRTLINMGDLIDRGPAYDTLRQAFNRLADQAKANGDRVVRLLGNHELAYLSGDVIKGGGPRGFPDIIPDKVRAQIKANIVSDINNGYVVAAFAKDGKLFTHAGVSKGVFPEFAGKTPDYIASRLNRQLLKDAKYNNFGGKIYARGRTEWSSAASPNERAQGGPFWLRPQEAKVSELDLGFTQVVGHNPGFEVREIWGPNFVETDVGTIGTGKVSAYIDTPYITTKSTPIVTEALGGKAPQITGKLQLRLMANAMRDTIADVFLGWDGRIQAIKNLKANDIAVKQLIKEINAEIKIRQKAGDTTGIKLLNRMKMELTSPEGRDYVYGGIDFWRDIVMGRQNSVKVLDGGLRNLKAPQLDTALVAIGSVRNRLGQFSDADMQHLFGMSRNEMLAKLDISKVNKANIEAYQTDVARLSQSLVDIVDTGLERNFAHLLDREKLASEYVRRLQDRATDTARISKPFNERYYEQQLGRAEDVIGREIARELNERVSNYYRQVRGVRQPAPPRGVRAPRAPKTPRTPAPPYGEYAPSIPPTHPYPPYPPTEPTVPRTPVPPKPPYPPVPRVTTSIDLGKKQTIHREGPALAVLKQGAFWISAFPPFRGKKPDLVYSRQKPPWGSVVAKGRHSPQKTLRSIGRVPYLVEIPMGIVTARIRGGRHLSFSRNNGRKRGRVMK